jgi:predicted methyltransferase
MKAVDKTADVSKTVKNTSNAKKTEQTIRAEKSTSRAGMDFTKKGKKEVIETNKAKNNGKTVCEGCKTETIPAKKIPERSDPSKERDPSRSYSS